MKYITILIPLYNGSEFLKDSLTSILNQTYKKWELIIGINGHLDDKLFFKNIKKIVNDIITHSNINFVPDIRIINYNTKGKPYTLNAMVLDSKYEYISLLDVDDIWLPTKLEEQLPFIEDYDIVGTKCKYFGTMDGSPNIPTGNISNHDFFLFNPMINSSTIIHKNNAIWSDNGDGLDDYDMWFRLKFENKKFYNVDNILCLHRIHPQSAFNNSNYNYLIDLKNKWRKTFNT